MSLEMIRGKTGLFAITVTDDDGNALNLTGYNLYFHAAIGSVTITRASGTGITVTDEAGGLATLAVEPADTTDITQGVKGSGYAKGRYELVMSNGTTSISLDEGDFIVRSNVGTP